MPGRGLDSFVLLHQILPKCAHRPEFLLARHLRKSADGKDGPLCLARGYTDFLREKLVAHNRKYAEELICLDGLNIQHCYATNHGHALGDVFQQVRGLVSLCQPLGEIDPEYLVWSNAGN